MSHHLSVDDLSLAGLVNSRAGVSVERCYQCGKCSAGCPAAGAMDLAPSVVLRNLQVRTADAEARVLASYSIWLCLACQTCLARCPMEVDLPKVMDVLRAESLKRRLVNPKAKDIVAFHTSFLNTIKRFGRMWEMGMVGEYKLRTGHLLQDVAVAPVMFFKGKLSLVPEFCGRFAGRIFTAKERA